MFHICVCTSEHAEFGLPACADTDASARPGARVCMAAPQVLMPLGNGVMPDQCVRRAASFSSQVVVCTSTDPADDAIQLHCEGIGVICVRGSMDNVFERCQQALADPRVKPTPVFVRATGDNPLLCTESAQQCIDRLLTDPTLDHVRADCFVTGRPLGMAVEVVNAETFRRIDSAQLDAAQREHVAFCLCEKAGCSVAEVPNPLGLSSSSPSLGARLTVDHPEDCELMERLHAALGDDPSTRDALKLLDARPELMDINGTCGRIRN